MNYLGTRRPSGDAAGVDTAAGGRAYHQVNAGAASGVVLGARWFGACCGNRRVKEGFLNFYIRTNV